MSLKNINNAMSFHSLYEIQYTNKSIFILKELYPLRNFLTLISNIFSALTRCLEKSITRLLVEPLRVYTKNINIFRGKRHYPYFRCFTSKCIFIILKNFFLTLLLLSIFLYLIIRIKKWCPFREDLCLLPWSLSHSFSLALIWRMFLFHW